LKAAAKVVLDNVALDRVACRSEDDAVYRVSAKLLLLIDGAGIGN
jgi:hypothetical protein